jgi:hypothetical protein
MVGPAHAPAPGAHAELLHQLEVVLDVLEIVTGSIVLDDRDRHVLGHRPLRGRDLCQCRYRGD